MSCLVFVYVDWLFECVVRWLCVLCRGYICFVVVVCAVQWLCVLCGGCVCFSGCLLIF